MTIVDSKFSGGSNTASALENTSEVFVRNVQTSGYDSALQHRGTVVAGSNIDEFTSRSPHTLFAASPTSSLKLTVQEPPRFIDGPASQWANVQTFGAVASDWGGDTAAIQAAIDSGASTIYFPPGRYLLSGSVRVRGNVRHIIGLGVTLSPDYGTYADGSKPQPMFVIENGSGDSVTIEGVDFWKLHSGSPDHSGLINFQHETSRSLYLKDVGSGISDYSAGYRSGTGAGTLFLDNVVLSRLRFAQNQDIFARQLNSEDSQTRVVNSAARLWVLGIKTEGTGTVIATSASGQTEVLGGALYPVSSSLPGNDIAFVNDGAKVSLSYATIAYETDTDYKNHVQEKRNSGSATAVLSRGDLAGRGLGRFVPLYVGR